MFEFLGILGLPLVATLAVVQIMWLEKNADKRRTTSPVHVPATQPPK